jgi:hypothetical protein
MGERLKPVVLKTGFPLAMPFEINHLASSEVIIFGCRKAVRRPSVQLNVQPDPDPTATSPRKRGFELVQDLPDTPPL